MATPQFELVLLSNWQIVARNARAAGVNWRPQAEVSYTAGRRVSALQHASLTLRWRPTAVATANLDPEQWPDRDEGRPRLGADLGAGGGHHGLELPFGHDLGPLVLLNLRQKGHSSRTIEYVITP